MQIDSDSRVKMSTGRICLASAIFLIHQRQVTLITALMVCSSYGGFPSPLPQTNGLSNSRYFQLVTTLTSITLFSVSYCSVMMSLLIQDLWVCEDFDNMVICGDFNYPKISWDAPDTSRSANEQAFVEALHDHYLTRIQRKPTRGSSVLDLVITSVSDQTSVSEVLEIDKAGLFTDHRTVFFKFHTLINAPVKTHRSVYDYAN